MVQYIANGGNNWAYIRGGGAYFRNEVSVSTCGGLIHGGLIHGGAYSRRFTVSKLYYVFLSI